MYERFTDRARHLMQFANQEAQRFNHEYIGTEHILLGLIKEGGGVAAHVLKNLDVDLRKLRLEVETLIQSGPEMVVMGKLPQTPRAKKVIEYSMEEARNLNHNYVGTEHILLGLLREQDGVAAQVLMNLGLRLREVRLEILNLLGHGIEVDEFEAELAGPFADHPFIKPLIALWERTRGSSGRVAGKTAAHETISLERHIKQVCALLHRQNSSPRAPERVLLQYFTPVAFPSHDCIRQRESEQLLDYLMKQKTVLLVGLPGSGRNSLLEQVAESLFKHSLQTLPHPIRLVQPNHVSLRGGDCSAYPDSLGAATESLATSGEYLLAVPNIHDLSDAEAFSANCIQAWKQMLVRIQRSRRAIMGITTFDGAQSLRTHWPGIVDNMIVFELPPVADHQVEAVLTQRISDFRRLWGLRFEDDFLPALLELRHNWQSPTAQADPGRCLELLSRTVSYARKVHCDSIAPISVQRERKREHLVQQVSNDARASRYMNARNAVQSLQKSDADRPILSANEDVLVDVAHLRAVVQDSEPLCS